MFSSTVTAGRSTATEEQVGRSVARVGEWAAWGTVAMTLAYGAAVAASGALRGYPEGPAWALAHVLTILAAPVMVTLIAAVANRAGARDRVFGALAVGWMLALAVLTIPVHFVDLTVTSGVDRVSPSLQHVLGFEWPSITYAVEIVAWQIFLPLSLLCAALVVRGRGKARLVRVGFLMIAVLCLAGLAGPITGDMNLRLIAVVGYGMAFPATCVVLALLLRDWAANPSRRASVSR